MRKVIHTLTLAALATCAATLSGHAQEPKKTPREKLDPKKVQALMHRKLEDSQKVLEALVLNDLDKVVKHGEELIQIRKDLDFKVYKTPEYELWSDEFLRSTENLVKGARDKNLEAAKLNYLGMTLACFHCHSYVRDVGRAAADSDNNR